MIVQPSGPLRWFVVRMPFDRDVLLWIISLDLDYDIVN